LGKKKDNSVSEHDPRDPSSTTLGIVESLIGAEHFQRESGSSTILLGARRTMKTDVSIDFLHSISSDTSDQKSTGLLISLLDNQGSIEEQTKMFCRPTGVSTSGNERDSEECSKHILPPQYFRPGFIAPDEFFHLIEQRFLETLIFTPLPRCS